MDIHEHTEKSSTAVKNLAKEVAENINKKIAEMKRKVANLREKCAAQERRFLEEQYKLTKAVDDAKSLNHSLIGRRTAIQNHNANDEEELAKLDKDNLELSNQVKELQVIHKSLAERKDELTEKHSSVMYKYSILKEKHDSKLKEQRAINQHYKNVMGLDIVRIRDNVIKVLFHNLPLECFVTIDFNNPVRVIESNPALDIDKMNFLFKETKCFYKFIKQVRAEFKAGF